jgi:ferritin-like protein
MSEAYTEPFDKIGSDAQDIAKAMKSLREELEAVDFYHQRVQTAKDPELKKLMAHNRDEEKEHAAMLLEWLRRNMEGWDNELHDYLFTTAPITEIEDAAAGEDGGAEGGQSLGIGKL